MNPGPNLAALPRGQRRLAWAALAVLLFLVAAFLLLWVALNSEAVTRRVADEIEAKMPGPGGYEVSVQAISPGIGGAEIYGLRLRSREKDIELWADLVRIEMDVEALREPGKHDLPIDLEGVRLRLPDGSVLAVDRMSVLRRTDRSWESKGEGELETGGRLAWDLALAEGVRRSRASLRFEAFPLRLARIVFPDALPQARLDYATLDGDLRLHPASYGSDGPPREAALRMTGNLALSGLVLEDEELLSRPVGDLELGFAGTAEVVRTENRIGVRDLPLLVNGVELRLSGELDRVEGQVEGEGENRRLAVALTLPEAPCDEVVGAIPRGLLGEYAGFELAGRLSATLDLSVERARPDATRLEITVDDGCDFLRVPEPARLDRFDEPFRHVARGPNDEPFLVKTGPGTSAWANLGEISPYVVQAVMAHEDATFPSHSGFAVFAMESSLEDYLRAGEVMTGASTISMQLAKNLFLSREQTLDRKISEVLLTWWLERSLSKREIMELYLNVIEYGPEIYGIRPAARHYFRVDPIDLTPGQSVFLATLLPAPVDRHRQFEAGRLWESTRHEMAFLLRHMHEKGRIERQALDRGLRELEYGVSFDPTFVGPNFVHSFFGPRLSPPEALPASGG